MIVSLFLQIIAWLMNFISFLLPRWSLPDYIITSWNGSIGFLALANGFFPIHAIFKVTILVFAFEIALIVSRLIMGLFSVVRGGGSIDV